MAQIVSKTLLRHSTLRFLPFKSSPFIPSSLSLSFHRHRSSKPQLLEIDLSSSSSSSSSSSPSDGSGEVEVLAIKTLDEMIHMIVVQKSTPDWLPFIPGSSFWVPPHTRPFTVGDLLGKLTNQLTEEESLSLSTLRGWPCSAFYVQETSSSHPLKVDMEVKVPEEEEVEVKVDVVSDSENTSRCEDEEG